MRTCRVCGCTDDAGCPPYGCHWVEEDLCSTCHQVLEEVKASGDFDVAGKRAREQLVRGAELAIKAYREQMLGGL